MWSSAIIAIYLCIAMYKALRVQTVSHSADPWLKKDMCNEYFVRSEVWREMGSTQSGQCDRSMSEGWYRFFTPEGRSAQLPVVCIKTGMCGANIPLRVDLRGQGLPSDGQTLEIDVCGSYNIQGKWDCCVLRQDGYIHNCGGYYVYKLRAPDRCSVGYCMLDEVDDVEHLTVKTGEIVSRDDMPSYQTDILQPRDIYERDVGNVPPPCPDGQTLCPDGECIPPSRSCNFIPINFPSSHTTRASRRGVNRNFTFNVIRRSKLSTQSTGQSTTHRTVTDSEVDRNNKIGNETSQKSFVSSSSQSIISGIDVRILEADKLQSSVQGRTFESSERISTAISLKPSYISTVHSQLFDSSVFSSSSDDVTTHFSVLPYSAIISDAKHLSSSNSIVSLNGLNTLQISSTHKLPNIMSSQVINNLDGSDTSISTFEVTETRSSDMRPHVSYRSESFSSDKMHSTVINPSKVASHFVSSAIADVIAQIASQKKQYYRLIETAGTGQHSSSYQSLITSTIRPSSVENKMSHAIKESVSSSSVYHSSIRPHSNENNNLFTKRDDTMTRTSSPTTKSPALTSTLSKDRKVAISAVSMKFSMKEYYEMSLENFVRELRSVLASSLNIFYTPYSTISEKFRHERSTDYFYKPKDVQIWNMSLLRDLDVLHVDVTVKDRAANQTAGYIPSDILSNFLLRKDVVSYINDILADYNVTLIGVFTEMSSNTTEKQLNITIGSDVRSSGEESWFVENFGLFMIMVVLSSSFIVCSALGLWQVCSWAKCRRLQRKSGKYYIKCEKAFLREVKHILPVENPLSDADIMQDEGEMTEKCLYSNFSDITEDKESITTGSCYGSDETESLEKGWIVPITEFIDDEMFLRNDCTKL